MNEQQKNGDEKPDFAQETQPKRRYIWENFFGNEFIETAVLFSAIDDRDWSKLPEAPNLLDILGESET